MQTYRRFVSYVYQYENGKKAGNRGFIKVEARGNTCSMQISLKGICRDGNGSCKVYGFKREEGLLKGSLLAVCPVKTGIVQEQLVSLRNEMGEAQYSLHDLSGVIFRGDDETMYGTQWDDAPMKMENFQPDERSVKAARDPENQERPDGAGQGAQPETAEPESIETGGTGIAENMLAESAEAEISEKALEGTVDIGGPESVLAEEVSAGIPERVLEETAGVSVQERVLEETVGTGIPERVLEESAGAGIPERVLEETVDAGIPERVLEESAGAEIPERVLEETVVQETSERTLIEAAGTGGEGAWENVQAEWTGGSEDIRETDGDVHIQEEKKMPPKDPAMSPVDGWGSGEISAELLEGGSTAEMSGLQGIEHMPERSDPLEESERPYHQEEEEGLPEILDTTVDILELEEEAHRDIAGDSGMESDSMENDGAVQVRAAECDAADSVSDAESERTPFSPFTDGVLEDCRKISMEDLRFLDPRDQGMRSNRFVQHGYQMFGHLLLAKVSRNSQYILGVPGMYQKQERFMADMFGFHNFKCAGRKGNRAACFGYWYRLIYPPKLDRRDKRTH